METSEGGTMMREEAAVLGAAQAEVTRGCDKLLAAALDCHKSKDYETARRLYQEVLVHEPAHPKALHFLGLVEHATGHSDRGIGYIESAIALTPAGPEAYSNLAALQRAVGDLDAALANARQAIALSPDFATAYANLGDIHESLGENEAALAAYLRACEINPGLLDSQLNAVQLLRKLGRSEEALAMCETASKRQPDEAEHYFRAGQLLRELLRPREALQAYRQALALRPAFAEAYCNLGNILHQQGAVEGAIAAYQEAIAVNPDLAEAHGNLGAAYESLDQRALSLDVYRRALECDPDFLGVRLQLYHHERQACDWRESDKHEAAIRAALPSYDRPVVGFALLSIESSPADHQRFARLWAQAHRVKPGFSHQRPQFSSPRKKKLKIGYLSADYYNHATAILMADLFECHDRSQFEIIAYSYGRSDGDAMRQRLLQAFDDFVDLCGLDDREAAQRIFDDGVDILVELKGYTQHARTLIAAHRPAPIQVNFIGYPGTMGADFIDYIIADPIVLPMDDQVYYDEKIVHLPECYQPNDRQRKIGNIMPTRRDCGLPEQGFVFCCFNNTYKITSRIFDIWMRLLHRVEGSVLWLFDAHPDVRANLAREAAGRGIDPARLVFAPRVQMSDHLVRQKLADLFLDTQPYNAHTTASEALWVGLPVLTISGATFAGRVAASLLQAMGAPELITNSPAEYEQRALYLASHPDELADLRHKLALNRETSPLFDTPRFARHLEAAFQRMWALWASGEEPQAFSVSPLPGTAPLQHAQDPSENMSPRQDEGACLQAEPAHLGSVSRISRHRYEACPLCASRNIAFFSAEDCASHPAYSPHFDPKITWLSCQACEHVFTEGYFVGVDAPQVAVRAKLGADIETSRRIAAKIVARIARHKPQGLWLDIGVGDGGLLFTAAEWGFAAQALAHDEQTVAQLRQLGFKAECGRPEDRSGPQIYDVLSMVDALQRAPDPKATLAAARRLLLPDGLLYLSLPNKDALAFAFLHAHGENPYWGELADYHLFGRERLYSLLRNEGFAPIDYQVSESHRIGMEIIARRQRS
jgi:protein O-GlcNAc transferase